MTGVPIGASRQQSPQQAPLDPGALIERLHASKVEEHRHSPVEPVRWETLLGKRRGVDASPGRGPQRSVPVNESGQIPLAPGSVDDPGHVAIERLARSLQWRDVRMLELENEPMVGANVGNVLFGQFVVEDNFLPGVFELPLPRPVPRGFGLPPGVADAHALVRPMVNSLVPAFCDHRLGAARTGADKTRLGFMPLPIDKCVPHGISICVEAALPFGSSQMLFLMEILRSAASMSWCCFFLSSALRMIRSPVIGMAWVASGAILCSDGLSLANGDGRSTGDVDRQHLEAD